MNKFSPIVLVNDEQSGLREFHCGPKWCPRAMVQSWTLIFPVSIAVVVSSNEQYKSHGPSPKR